MTRKTLLFLICAALTPALAGATPEAEAGFRVEREGIAIDVSLDDPHTGQPLTSLREGEDVTVRLRIRDVHTGEPSTTLYPAGWMDLLPETPDDDPEACKSKVENFIGGGLLAVPELDLNVYYVLALNDEASISVVHPLFGFGGSKLLTTVKLDSPGEDWLIGPRQQRLYVSMPKSGRVAVVDTSTWKLIDRIETGPLPTRLALQGDGRFLWATFEGVEAEGASGVSVIDLETLQEVARVETGRGRHDLVFTGDDRWALVSNSESGTVTVVDVRTREKSHDLETGGTPVSLSYSAAAEGALVADAESGRISLIGGHRPRLTGHIQASPGLTQVRFTDAGRFALAVNPMTDELSVIDAAKRRIVQNGKVESGPDRVSFSDTLAYIRHRASDIILMVPLDELGREGEPIPVVAFPAGKHPAGQTTMPSSADTIVQAPGAAAVLVANPLDRQIYYYKEGMAAPMGHFKNYGRMPRAIQVIDRSLREVEAGVYQTTVKMRRPGSYDLALYVDSPRIAHCFAVEVAANPDLERQRRASLGVQVHLESKPAQLRPGQPSEVLLEVRDSATGERLENLKDVRVLTFRAPGTWQQRSEARPTEDGRYAMTWTPPNEGVYYVFAEIPSRKLTFNRSPSLLLEAVDKMASKDSRPSPGSAAVSSMPSP